MYQILLIFLFYILVLSVLLIILTKRQNNNRTVTLIWLYYHFSLVVMVIIKVVNDFSELSNLSIMNVQNIIINTSILTITVVLIFLCCTFIRSRYYKILINSFVFLVLGIVNFFFIIQGITNFLWLLVFCAAAIGLSLVFDIFIFDEKEAIEGIINYRILPNRYIDEWNKTTKELFSYGINAAFAFTAAIGIIITILYTNSNRKWDDVEIASKCSIFIIGFFLTTFGFLVWVCIPYFKGKKRILYQLRKNESQQ